MVTFASYLPGFRKSTGLFQIALGAALETIRNAVPLNRVWLKKMSFWTGSLSKSMKTCDEWSTFAIPGADGNTDGKFLNIYFHDFSVKHYLILYAKQSKSGSESSVSCLKQGSKMRSFCLKQGRGLRASATHL